jgi:hypothetical protein
VKNTTHLILKPDHVLADHSIGMPLEILHGRFQRGGSVLPRRGHRVWQQKLLSTEPDLVLP